MKKSQVWIETVIYTLIGLAIIGVLLSVVKPAIENKKDQILIDKSLTMMETIHDKVEEVVRYGTGNSRMIEIQLSKGNLAINPAKENIEFSMKSSYMYSELGENVSVGDINVTTTKEDSIYNIKLVLAYRNLNLTWNGKETSQTFQPAPAPYKITLVNNGTSGQIIQVDFS
jgi:hypothetical protein